MQTETATLPVDGGQLYYEVEGTGPAVVLVHAGIANLRMWDDQVAALRDAFRVIRYDTRGFGRTETGDVPFSNRADIAALLDHLGEPSAHLVGLSRGAMIALDFTLEFPDRVRSLTVAAGGIGGYESPAEGPASTWEEPERLLEAKDWEGISDWETRYWVDGPGQPQDRVDPAIRQLVHDWILDNYRAEKTEGKPIPLDPPAVGRLDGLRVPLLVMYGTFDEPGTSESMRHLASVVPGAQLEEFPTAHLLNLEQPGRFNRVLRDFLEGAETGR